MPSKYNAQKYAQMKANGYKDQRKWEKANMKAVTIKLHKEYEADVIAFLDGLDNKRQWFIDACRKAMIDE